MEARTAGYTSDLAAALADDLLERFLRYVRVDTQAARDRTGSPSTPGQLDLSRMLVGELLAIGLDDASLDENGYVMATLPSTSGAHEPVIGLVAHVDTSPDAPGAGVEPIVHRGYDGGVIELRRQGTVLDPSAIRGLAEHAGEDIVTSSGDTLLGADDKAGVAEIMSALAHLAAHPELPRPTLRVCFTPDEEVGAGALLFDIERFGALGAYTIDGSDLGELQDETFSAKEARVTIRGVDVHPGFAHGKMVNALRLAARAIAALPADTLAPETSSGREGYLHPYELEATTVEASFRVLLRDFDDERLASHEELLRSVLAEVVGADARASFEIEVEDQYPNMRSYLEPHPELSAAAERAIRAEGIEPLRRPARGGTDGSLLSAKGLPTPNIFAGGHDFHSVREWVSLHDMAAAGAVIVRLAGEWAGD